MRTTQKTPIAKLRVAARLTQEEAAARMNMSLGGYRKLETGERAIKVEQIRKAGRAFGVSPEKIVPESVGKIPLAVQDAFEALNGRLTAKEERALLDVLDLIVRARSPNNGSTPGSE